MNNTDLHTELTALANRAADSLPKHNACGDPLRTWTKVVNGHRVHVRITGWDEATPVFEIDGSTQPLTIAEAEAQVAA